MAWGYVAVGAGTLIGGYLQGQGAQSAAEQQAAAGQGAIATQERALAEQRRLIEPFRTAGLTALERLVKGAAPGGEFMTPFAMDQALPTFKPFEAKESEAQKFATQSAIDAMRNQMAVGGQALSSNAIVGAGELGGKIGSQYEQQAYNQWLASQSQEFQQALAGRQQAMGEFQANRAAQMAPLQYLTGLSQASAAGQAANVGATGSAISGLQTGIGNVQAAGTVGQASALSSGIGNISQMMLLNQLSQQNQ